ncbi:hypothetical protein KK083_16250 [Fulvivirgaceae bacterium PWU4]|uniref:Uncharacterized protein n=1 Tax=Chryseosolibacter histidini TaxID=2782349 RepID=A0AAP2DNG9_9BACT|nr:hypothetical protein [Chryseosolibacter histidini]MBT1698443.1 hypothetical protein [Chryseosolibacter histidini]
MAYLKFLIATVIATWSILSFAYSAPFATDPSHQQGLFKQTSYYTVSSCAVLEETLENDCKKTNDQDTTGTTIILSASVTITSLATPVTHQKVQGTSPLYLLHRRLLI